MSALLTCLCTIALIQNDTPTSRTKPLLDKRNPIKYCFIGAFVLKTPDFSDKYH